MHTTSNHWSGVSRGFLVFIPPDMAAGGTA